MIIWTTPEPTIDHQFSIICHFCYKPIECVVDGVYCYDPSGKSIIVYVLHSDVATSKQCQGLWLRSRSYIPWHWGTLESLLTGFLARTTPPEPPAPARKARRQP